MKKNRNSICGYLVCISAIIVMLITSLDVVCFHSGFYEREYENSDRAEALGVSDEDLMASTDALLDYLRGEREDIVVDIILRGNEREAFNNKEKMHMEDVKKLYDHVMLARTGCLLVLIGCFIYLAVKLKQNVLEFVAERFLKTAVCFVTAVVFLGFYALVDFTGFWTSFHRLFFRNELWLLDPTTDFMINMFPEQLFFHLIIWITVFFLIPFALSGALCYTYLKNERLGNMPADEEAKEL